MNNIIKDLTEELTRLQKIETAAKAYLDSRHCLDSQQRSPLAKMLVTNAHAALVEALGWTPPAPPAPPEGTLVTDFDSLKVGDVVLRTLCNGTVDKAEIVKLFSDPEWHETKVLEGDKVRNAICSLDVKAGRVRLLSRAPEAPAPQSVAPTAPVGTLVSWFEDLRAGDKVRIEGKSCGTQVATLKVFYPNTCRITYWSLEIHEGKEDFNCLDANDWDTLKVYRLSPRRPYVKDGRWIAEPGDRFVRTDSKLVMKGIRTVVRINQNGDYVCTTPGGEEEVWFLSDQNWAPVTKPYVKDGRWVAQVGDRFRPLNWVPSKLTGVVSVVEIQPDGPRVQYILKDSRGQLNDYNLVADLWAHVETEE